MLVVVASPRDAVAGRLVERWAAHGACRLGPADLSVAGWRHYVGGSALAGAAAAVVGGRPVETAAISGVLTRLPRVAEADLAHVVAADRGYAAAEMTAFLLSWLAALTCPVLNRPTPGCLSGPSWWPEQWAAAAARVGIPTRPMRRLAAPPGALPGVPASEPADAPAESLLPLGEGEDEGVLVGRGGREPASADRRRESAPISPPEERAEAEVTVTVVGDRCLGPVDAGLAEQARRLAAAAGVDLLAVRFAGPSLGAAFLGADPWPDVSAPPLADAVLAWLRSGPRDGCLSGEGVPGVPGVPPEMGGSFERGSAVGSPLHVGEG